MSQTTARLTEYRLYILLFFFVVLSLVFITRIPSSPVDRTETNLMSSSPLGVTVDDIFPAEMIVGGLGRELEKDDRVGPVVEKIKPILEEQAGIKFKSLDIINYRTQVVSGTNYFVKAKAKHAEGGGEQIVHLRIYQPIRKELELTAYQLGKTLEDKLEYFQ